jgi:hypothetical protein
MRSDAGNIEVVDEKMAEVLRRKTGAERLQIAYGLFRTAQRLIRSRLRSQHPSWDEAQINAETARRISHGSI